MLLSLLVLLFVFLPRLALCTRIEVPNDAASISDALQLSFGNDTILVHPGVYHERLIFPSHDVVMISEYIESDDSSAIDNTVIDASSFALEDSSSVLTFGHPNSRACQVIGFTLTGGHGKISNVPGVDDKFGGCIYMSYASPTIRSCRIVGNQSAERCVLYSQYGSPSLSYCRIYDNCGERNLIWIGYGSVGDSALVEWNDIYNNYGCGAVGPHLFYNAVEGQFATLAIRNNYFHDSSGRVYMGVHLYYCYADVTGNIFERLSTPTFTTLIQSNKYPNVFRDNIVRDCNTGEIMCMAISGDPPNIWRAIVERNWFENNISSTSPSCLWMSHPNADVRNNVFLNNVGQVGAVQFSQSPPEGCNVLFEGNHFLYNQATGPDYVGSAFATIGDGPFCTFTNNVFEGNEGMTIHSDLLGFPEVNMPNNYWGDPSGPFHPTENPGGQGDSVPANVHVTPWLTEPPTTDADIHERLNLHPEDWALESAFPNPFNATTSLRITASKPQPFDIIAYNILGQQVARVWQGVIAKDTPTLIHWNGTDDRRGTAASGIYYLVATPHGPGAGPPKSSKVVLLR